MSNLLVYGLLALAVLASAAGLYAKVHGDGERQGEAVVQGRWDEANRTAQAQADALRQQRTEQGRQTSIALQQAEGKADDYEKRWKASRDAARRIPLALCPAMPPNAATGTVATPVGPLRLQLTYSFLRQWDAAWTGPNGQPVFGDSGGSAKASPAAGSPVTLDDALDNHAENARRCSANARQLDRLTNLIRELQKGR